MHMLIQSSPAYYDTTVDLHLRAYEVEGLELQDFVLIFAKNFRGGPQPPLQYNYKRLIVIYTIQATTLL